MRWYHRALIAVMLCASATAYGADADGRYQIWGPGITNCKSYVEMATAQNADFTKMAFWAGGYLTAYNQLSDKTWDILGKDGTVSGVMLWLVGFCNKHPNEILAIAIRQFTAEHKDNRITSKP